jgi:hypothetical protein
MDVAPTYRWIVRSGVNYVPARSKEMKNILEFPFFPGYRAGIAYPFFHESRATTMSCAVGPQKLQFITWTIDDPVAP